MASPAHARTNDAELTPGARVAERFVVTGLLGRGGMGAVYEAHDERIDRMVALKVLTLEGETAKRRFAAEARAASRISSRHVAALHDFGSDEAHGVSYLVLERLDGRTLEQTLAHHGRLEVRIAVAIAKEIAEALAAAHAAGVVHRDLKPGNVWMLADGGVKVIDFGIARLEGGPEAGPSITGPGKILGTPRYMAPEAVRGSEVTSSADLYALGIVLFEMITGTVPFDDPVPTVICAQHLHEPVPRMSERAPDVDVPPSIEGLVDALLEKDPRRRPVNALEVAAQLRGMTDVDEPVRVPAADGTTATSAPTAAVSGPIPLVTAPRAALRGRTAIVIGALALASGAIAAIAWPASDEPAVATELRAPSAPAIEPPSAEPVVAVETVRDDARLDDALLGDALLDDPLLDDSVMDDSVMDDSVPAAARSETVMLWIDVRPPIAETFLDGEPIDGPARVPADGRTHVLEARARGYVTRRVELPADRDRTVAVNLARRSTRREVPSLQREW
ncbi:MAG: serine/threonine-protein kinase [Sandaracinaceae bacterium]